MKQLRTVASVALAMGLLALAAPAASATTLEVKGVPKNEAVSIEATLSGSMLLTDPFGFFANTCRKSTVKGTTTTPFTGTRVGGPVATMSFSECTEEPLTVDSKGYLEVEHTNGTNGTVISKNAKVTVPSPFGTLTCVTPSTGTSLGDLTGVSSGKAILHLEAELECGFITGIWTGGYLVTSPAGLGVTS